MNEKLRSKIGRKIEKSGLITPSLKRRECLTLVIQRESCDRVFIRLIAVLLEQKASENEMLFLLERIHNLAYTTSSTIPYPL